jgi:hypothetical protein
MKKKHYETAKVKTTKTTNGYLRNGFLSIQNSNYVSDLCIEKQIR